MLEALLLTFATYAPSTQLHASSNRAIFNRCLQFSPRKPHLRDPFYGDGTISGSSEESDFPLPLVAVPDYPPEALNLRTAAVDLDAVTEEEVKRIGLLGGAWRTKFVCTIGPAACGLRELEV